METKNTKGAMEMSVGTIVTIVLLMSVLVLGIFFVSKIFTSSNNAIDSIDSQVQSEINQILLSTLLQEKLLSKEELFLLRVLHFLFIIMKF